MYPTDTALIIIDVQNDFLPGGALGVPEGDRIIPIINSLQREFETTFATQDWHPANHGSFAANHAGTKIGQVIDLNGLPQILWPVHCVQNTPGAELAQALATDRIAAIIRKGTDPQIDSYSGFFDNGHRKSTGLANELHRRHIQRVFLCGLATDYCVKFSALDARRLEFDVTLIENACRGVNLKPDDSLRATEEMRHAGVRIV